MKPLLLTIWLGSHVCFQGFCAAGQDKTPPNVLTEAEKKEGWKLLFDGKSLDGWMSWRTRKPLDAGGWKVIDGMLHHEKGGGDIYTAQAFENFELSMEWKTTGNSGIFIRVDADYKGGPIHDLAPEMQIDRKNAAHLYALYPVKGELIIHPDGWNHVKIRMQNGHGTHWFNGEKLYEYQIGSDDWKERVANSKFKKNADRFGMKAKGHIGMQDHGAAVSFRNIKIHELPGGSKD
jgi:hypothetical protein